MLVDKELTWLAMQHVGEISSVTQYDNALTNDVFLVTNKQNKRFIFKRLNQKARSNEDRQSEFLVQQLAYQHGLTAQVLAHNKEYKLQQYISGELLSKQVNNRDSLLATQLQRIHQLPALHAPKQRLVIELQRLKQQLSVPIDGFRFNHFCELASLLDKNCSCDILCHGDLSINNVLQDNNQLYYILDWEYAVLACRAYDLAFCCCINDFTHNECERLIEHYYWQCNLSSKTTLATLQAECHSYLNVFNYIDELWSLCFVDND